MRLTILIFVLLLIPAAMLFAACDPAGAPHANVKINEFQNASASSNTSRVNFVELSSDVADLSLTCFKLIAFDQNCAVTAAIDLSASSMNGNYFTITDSSSKFTSIFGGTADLQNTGIATGTTTAGALKLVYAANSTPVGTACADITGVEFDAVGWAAADGTAATTFGGEGNEIIPGLKKDAGGSLQRTQDTTDNAADFQYACQSLANPGAANPASAACPCVFCDDFEDGDLTTPLWTPKKSLWLVNGKGEATSSVISKGDLVSPDFAGCGLCTFETMARVDAGGRASIFAWYVSGSNNVEIRLMQDKGKLFAKQKVGSNSVKQSVSTTIAPDTFYNLKATYDGALIHVLLDDKELITLTPIAAPAGKALFRIKSPSGISISANYQYISVY